MAGNSLKDGITSESKGTHTPRRWEGEGDEALEERLGLSY